MKNIKILCGIVGVCLVIGILLMLCDWAPRSASTPAGSAPLQNAPVAPVVEPPLATVIAAAPTNTPRVATVVPRAVSRLTEEDVRALRRAYTPPAVIAPDANVPRMEQTLLQNRRILLPKTRQFPKYFSGKQTPSKRGTVPYIVQFVRLVDEDQRARVAAVGGIVKGFLPNNAMLVECTEDVLAALGNVPAARAAEEFLPADKVQSFLAHVVETQPSEARISVTVLTFCAKDVEDIATAITQCGGVAEVSEYAKTSGKLRAEIPLAAVEVLATRGDVHWIEVYQPPHIMNSVAVNKGLMNVRDVWTVEGLTGQGQIIGHADTGLDSGVNDATMHPDFTNQIDSIFAIMRLNDARDFHGHGTHTAGSIVGDGSASSGSIRGVAYGAKLVHQAIADMRGSLGFTSLEALFAQTAARGARIHSDSWGDSEMGTYTDLARDLDAYVWAHPDFLPVFAAGNEGADKDLDGVVDANSVGSPATAKNCLSVGASENERPAIVATYQSAFPTKHYGEPIASSLTTDNPNGLAAFSGRGPCIDGRIKPDIVAPGTYVYSTASRLTNAGKTSNYVYMSGTSMATPLTAGACALARQWLIERKRVAAPSSALLRAVMITGAETMTPGQYGTEAKREISAVSPNNEEGWGRVNLRETLMPSNRLVKVYDYVQPAPGMTNIFFVTTTEAAPLDVVMAYVDYPALAGSAYTLVNDYDVMVETQTGDRLYPNGGRAPDFTNPTEVIRMPMAPAGRYLVRVIATAVPYAGGAVALCVRGALPAPETCSVTVRGTPEGRGVPSPNYGTFFVERNQTISLAATVPASAGDDGFGYPCVGWTGTGSVPASGTTNVCMVMIDQDSSITWQWAKDVHLRFEHVLAAVRDSTVTMYSTRGVRTGWYITNTVFTLEQSPETWRVPRDAELFHIAKRIYINSKDSFYIIGTDGTQSVNAWDITMDEPCTVRDEYWPISEDFEEDGIPDWYEILNFFHEYNGLTNETRLSIANGDPDADGMTTLEEYFADTNPRDAASRFTIQSFVFPTLCWIGGQSRTQHVQRATSPVGPWVSVFTNMPPTAVTNQWTVPMNETNAFYRLMIP